MYHQFYSLKNGSRKVPVFKAVKLPPFDIKRQRRLFGEQIRAENFIVDTRFWHTQVHQSVML